MSADKGRRPASASEVHPVAGEPWQMLDKAPGAFAITRGAAHAVAYANPAFRAVPGAPGVRTMVGNPVADLFEASVGKRLTALLDRALGEGVALRDRFLGPLEPGSRPWSCTVWPTKLEGETVEGLVIELSAATPAQIALSLQREVAERLLLSALRQSEAAEGAEASHKRAAFLASSGRQLAESLDTETTRTTVSGLTLPALAEWCIVDILEEEGTARRLTILHRDPGKQALVSELDSRWFPKAGDPFGVPAVQRNAQPVLIAENVDEALGIAAHDLENLRVLRAIGIGSLLTVPLIADRKVFGAITFVSAARELVFTDQDIELAEGLAARSSAALENARLYGDALLLRDKAEAATKTATKFLGTISHELRTPLNAIFGYVEVIALGIHGPVTEAQKTDLERISSNQRHLLVLIGELLNYLRLGSGRVLYDSVEVPLGAAVEHAVEILDPLITKKGLRVNILDDDFRIVACADPDSVHQIVVNLISNAVKFTNSGGLITVACEATAERAIITVSDDGRGIPSDKLEAIFEPFVQAHTEDSREHGGIGLGLAISRDLARAMHGDLTVESTEGAGSTFTLSLPSKAT